MEGSRTYTFRKINGTDKLSDIFDNVENSLENKAKEKIKVLISPVRKVYKKGNIIVVQCLAYSEQYL